MKKSSYAAGLIGLAALCLCAFTIQAAEPVALRVVTVQTSDVAAYVNEIDKGKAIMKKLGSPATIRVWQARFAGEQAGIVIVSVEFPDLAAVAADDERLGASAEFQSWLKGLDKIRTIVSDSLYMERTP
jgi:hypothetical protein